MTNSESDTAYAGANDWDVIVLGAGSTGENVADRAVKRGLTAVVVRAGRR